MDKIKIYAKSILTPVILGAVVGFLTSPSMDYETLQKPFLSPPGFLFPIVWTVLYVLMGISYGILKSKNQMNEELDLLYYTQLIVNLLWSVFFFTFKWRLFSFLWIILLIVLVGSMLVKFYKENKITGILQIPYLLWLIFASYLNIAVYILNR